MIDNILKNYKKITEEIIENIKNDIDINNLMDKRGKLIKELFESKKINISDVREAYLSKGLLDLDKKLKNVIEEEKTIVKEEIKDIHKRKSANNAYEKNRKINNYFNIKV